MSTIARVTPITVEYPEPNDNAASRRLTLCRVETTDGVVGGGEAITMWPEACRATEIMIEGAAVVQRSLVRHRSMNATDRRRPDGAPVSEARRDDDSLAALAHAWSSAIMTAASPALSASSARCLLFELKPFRESDAERAPHPAFLPRERVHLCADRTRPRHRGARIRGREVPDALMVVSTSSHESSSRRASLTVHHELHRFNRSQHTMAHQ